MSSLANLHLQSNTKINFTGGNLSSDAGLLLLHKFIDKLGLQSLLKNCFKTTDNANRQHRDYEILLQKIYQICAGYFTDDASDRKSTRLNSSHVRGRISYAVFCLRSEERRVGKECRSRWSPYH